MRTKSARKLIKELLDEAKGTDDEAFVEGTKILVELADAIKADMRKRREGSFANRLSAACQRLSTLPLDDVRKRCLFAVVQTFVERQEEAFKTRENRRVAGLTARVELAFVALAASCCAAVVVGAAASHSPTIYAAGIAGGIDVALFALASARQWKHMSDVAGKLNAASRATRRSPRRRKEPN